MMLVAARGEVCDCSLLRPVNEAEREVEEAMAVAEPVKKQMAEKEQSQLDMEKRNAEQAMEMIVTAGVGVEVEVEGMTRTVPKMIVIVTVAEAGKFAAAVVDEMKKENGLAVMVFVVGTAGEAETMSMMMIVDVVEMMAAELAMMNFLDEAVVVVAAVVSGAEVAIAREAATKDAKVMVIALPELRTHSESVREQMMIRRTMMVEEATVVLAEHPVVAAMRRRRGGAAGIVIAAEAATVAILVLHKHSASIRERMRESWRRTTMRVGEK